MKENIFKEGRLRGSKLEYQDGEVACGIWYPMYELLGPDASDDDKDDTSGISFEVALRDVDDAIRLLTRLRDAVPDKVADLEQDEDDA